MNIWDDSAFWGMFGAALAMLAIIGLIFGAFALVSYILRSLALYGLAANRGMGAPGLAWIPIVGSFRIGAVADDISKVQGSKTYFQYIILGGLLFSHFGQVFSVVPGILSEMGGYGLGDDFGMRQQMAIGSSDLSSTLSGVITLIGIATFVLSIICLNKIYTCYRPESATTWTVLSVIFPFLQPIFLFIIRNYAPDSEPDALPSPYYPPYGQQPNPYAPPPHGHYPQSGAYTNPNPNPNPNEYRPPDYSQPPYQQSYQPPAAPEPPKQWEAGSAPAEQPPASPWENGDTSDRI